MTEKNFAGFWNIASIGFLILSGCIQHWGQHPEQATLAMGWACYCAIKWVEKK